MKKVVIALACALGSFVATTSNATVLDFSSLTIGSVPGTVTIGDYQINYWYGATAVAFTSTGGFTSIGDNDATEGFGAAFTLSRVDGAAFTLNSLVFGFAGQESGSRVGVAPYAGGETVYINADGQTYSGTAAVEGVTEVGFDAYAAVGAVGIRSIDVSPYGAEEPESAVPEPASWAMMLVGFGAMGAAMRRRSTVRNVTFG